MVTNPKQYSTISTDEKFFLKFQTCPPIFREYAVILLGNNLQKQ